MSTRPIQTVCFVGAGTMGCYNALVAALAGFEAVLFDSDETALAAVPQRQQEMAAMLVGAGFCTVEAVELANQKIRCCSDLAAATADAELVSESVFEHLEVKREIHRQLDAVCPPHTLLTTNSSALLASDIEDVVARGDRFAALHTHLGSPLVDIVPGPRTAPSTLERLEQYVRSLGGEPLLLRKEHPGYVLNAMLGPMLHASLALVAQGEVSFQELDRAWMAYADAPMGPFGMIDLFGVNLLHDNWTHVAGQPHREQLRPGVLALLQPYVRRGALGMAAGEGFYHYPDPDYQRAGFAVPQDGDRERYCQLASIVIANALSLVANEVVSATEVDRAWRLGTHLDKVPSQMLPEVGEDALRRVLADHVQASRCPPELATVALDGFGSFTPNGNGAAAV